MNTREKLIQRTMDVQREITQAGLRRRDLLKMGLLSAGTGLLLPISGLSMRAAWAAGSADDVLGAVGSCPVPGVDLISPFTRPWIEELPRLVEKQRVLNNDPANISVGNGGGAPGPDPVGTLTGGDSKIRLLSEHPELNTATPYPNLSHQGWNKAGNLGNQPPKNWYEMREKQFNHVWHRDMPAGTTGQAAWGFDGVVPGPMFRAFYGSSDFLRIQDRKSTRLN